MKPEVVIEIGMVLIIMEGEIIQVYQDLNPIILSQDHKEHKDHKTITNTVNPTYLMGLMDIMDTTTPKDHKDIIIHKTNHMVKTVIDQEDNKIEEIRGQDTIMVVVITLEETNITKMTEETLVVEEGKE